MKHRSTYPTRPLPTDKYGNVYRGPKTYREAEDAAFHIVEQSQGMNPGWLAHQIKGLIRQAHKAGYTGVAAKLSRDFGHLTDA